MMPPPEITKHDTDYGRTDQQNHTTPKVKKLLYQLEQDLTCSLQGFFSKEELTEFDQEVGDGLRFTDTDGRLVARMMQPATITVARGYRWDGCSPKLNVLDLFWMGTPDGAIIGSERPTDSGDEDKHIPISHERVTHVASAVHDVLGYCKYEPHMPSLFRAADGKPDLWFSRGRHNRDRLFLKLLRKRDFQLGWLYYAAVCLLGPLHDLIRGARSNEKA